jgi:hypothetical protein
MNSNRIFLPRLAFWSLVVVAATWGIATIIFETSQGFPVTREQWGHRMIGWFINFVLVRTFVRGVRRYYGILGSSR